MQKITSHLKPNLKIEPTLVRTTAFAIKATVSRNKISSVWNACPNLHFIDSTVVGLIMLAIFIGFERFAARTQLSDSNWEPETV